MAIVTYTIYNNSVDTAATINTIDISTTLTEIQHSLDLTGWNEPWNSGYTNFQGDTTQQSESKSFSVEYSAKNGIIERYYTTGTWVHFEESPGSYFNEVDTVQTGWTVVEDAGGAYSTPGRTVAAVSGTSWISFSALWDNTPVPGDVITISPATSELVLNNTTNLQAGWVASGNGYSGGQTIVQVINGNTLEMSNPPSSAPTPGGTITFTSLNDEMITIAPGTSATFAMNYVNVTSSLGTYLSGVTLYATQGGAVEKLVNNFMLISAAPVTDPVSPYYDPTAVYYGDGGDVGSAPGDCADATDAAATSCDAGGSCFLGTAMIRMFDGTEKPIAEIKRGDIVLDALNPTKGNLVLGVKTMMANLETYMFSPVDGIDPFMTEEHPYYDQEGNVCAISDLAQELAPWFKNVNIVDTDNKYLVRSPTPVYNLFLQGGHTHFANGVPVDNIVGNGGSYVAYYLGAIDFDTYNSHARNIERSTQSVEMKVFYRKFLNLLGNYVLAHDNWISKKILQLGVYSLTHRSQVLGHWHSFANSPIGKLLTRIL